MELCRKVIRLYQEMVVSWRLSKATWEYLLSVLLHHTWQLLTHNDNRLGCVLATPILKVHSVLRKDSGPICLRPFLVVKEMSSNHKHVLIYKTTTILSKIPGENTGIDSRDNNSVLHILCFLVHLRLLTLYPTICYTDIVWLPIHACTRTHIHTHRRCWCVS